MAAILAEQGGSAGELGEGRLTLGGLHLPNSGKSIALGADLIWLEAGKLLVDRV
jgi:hypothetical protein